MLSGRASNHRRITRLSNYDSLSQRTASRWEYHTASNKSNKKRRVKSSAMFTFKHIMSFPVTYCRNKPFPNSSSVPLITRPNTYQMCRPTTSATPSNVAMLVLQATKVYCSLMTDLLDAYDAIMEQEEGLEEGECIEQAIHAWR
jgi:hypothetical protein